MSGFIPESKLLIEKYVKKGLLSEKLILSMWKATNKEDILKQLRKELKLSPEVMRTATFQIWEQWTELDEVYDKAESVLLRVLMFKHDGVIRKSDIGSKVLNTYMTNRAIESLKERGIIEVLRFPSEVVIILHPKFKQEVSNRA